MNLNEIFICPKCGNNKVTIVSSGAMFDDVRFDNLVCPSCETKWRAFSKITDIHTEVVYVAPQTPVENSEAKVGD